MTKQMLHQKTHLEHDSMVQVGHAIIGGGHAPIIAGPCAVESYDQLSRVAIALKQLGVPLLRAGAYKPRSSPYSFQGKGQEGIEMLSQIRKEYGLGIVTEVMAIDQIDGVQGHVDCIQVGARNMQNFDLLKALGRQEIPVLLKRGLSSTLQELLMSAEYIMAGGNTQVILCERGIRSFDTTTRNVLDLGAVAWLKQNTHLPVIVDPSHATGLRSLVLPAARAGIAIGSDGLIVEAHPVPHESVSDKEQAISLEELAELVEQVTRIQDALRPQPAAKAPVPVATIKKHPAMNQAMMAV